MVLNWYTPISKRQGLFYTFKKQLLSKSAMKQSRELQIAFNHPRKLYVSGESDFPMNLNLTLDLTPLVENLEEVRVSVSKEQHNTHSLTWVGKVTHILQNVSETQQICLTALAHQIGVYDLNQIVFEVVVAKGQDLATIRLKDEMIIEIVHQENLLNV